MTTVREKILTLWLAGAVVSGVSCRNDDVAGPADPVTDLQAAPLIGSGAEQALVFRQVSAGYFHTCGVTADDRAYCWGNNEFGPYADGSGELGDGTTTSRLTPVAVWGGLLFRAVSAGTQHTCGVTAGNVAYCWGNNSFGSLGDGTRTTRLTPVPVSGGLRFRTVSASGGRTCGLTTADLAYCWGYNHNGQLGDGTTSSRLEPAAVSGGYHFRQLIVGGYHTCGVTTSYRVLCWGDNSYGQVGDGSTVTRRLRPVEVAGGLSVRHVSAGFRHTCAVTRGDRAFCWGYGAYGQIGDGKNLLRRTPRAVAGGLSFERLTLGFYHSCGETTDNRAFCWGYNGNGQLGDGTTSGRLAPVVIAGFRFRQLSAGREHTCGHTGSVTYCWGWNELGQLGDGTTTRRLRPVAVAGPS